MICQKNYQSVFLFCYQHSREMVHISPHSLLLYPIPFCFFGADVYFPVSVFICYIFGILSMHLDGTSQHENVRHVCPCPWPCPVKNGTKVSHADHQSHLELISAGILMYMLKYCRTMTSAMARQGHSQIWRYMYGQGGVWKIFDCF